jgi:hypothetical protein
MSCSSEVMFPCDCAALSATEHERTNESNAINIAADAIMRTNVPKRPFVFGK